jgi:subtilisin family serine protease
MEGTMPRKLDLGDTKRTDSVNVVYVHGVSRQDPESALRDSWDIALFEKRLGGQSRFAYWSDLRWWDEASGARIDAKSLDKGAKARVKRFKQTDGERRGEDKFVETYFDQLSKQAEEAREKMEPRSARGGFRPKLVPDFLEGPLLWALARDAKEYLFDREFRASVRRRLADRLLDPQARYLIVAHSLGSVIAFDELSDPKYKNHKGRIELLTIGTPLGQSDIFERVRDLVKPNSRGKLRKPACVSSWVDFRDSFDPVALGGGASRFIAGVESLYVDSSDSINPFEHHYALNYLAAEDVRAAASGRAPGAGKFLRDDIVASDVRRAHERKRGVRQSVLIELEGVDDAATLVEAAASVEATLRELVGEEIDTVPIDRLARFICAPLTEPEIDRLLIMQRERKLAFGRIWRNSVKRANGAARTLVPATPAAVLQVKTARLGYEADGLGIGWAVLDTGIRPDHKHFSASGAIAAMYDCTKPGAPKAGVAGAAAAATQPGFDRNGHGTHVAAVIAGGDPKSTHGEISMAPKATIHSYKVLADDGSGDDASIIKALDHIAAMNAKASRPVIHGVNLSLGGPFNSEVYGTGHSPLCRELRRLVQSGVVVCIAAGNEGAVSVRTPDKDAPVVELQLDVSIGDPANLEDAIAVGSVHSTMPERFGVSYFSSRGPTADGRAKPDVVAPGEKILSADANFDKPGGSPYIKESGSSMACPHVSGLIAAFLSVRRGYIGYPERVKEVLMASCLDLKRDRYFQGAGLPNLVKMLLATA